MYTEKAKYPGKQPVLRTLLLDDLPVIVLSFTFVEGLGFASLLATGLLFAAMTCVYELGYRENDFVAAGREWRPTRSLALDAYRDYAMSPSAWIWAFVLSGVAILLLRGSGSSISLWVTFAAWIGFLLVLRGTFWIHNHLSEKRRLASFAALHILKTFGFGTVVATNALGCYSWPRTLHDAGLATRSIAWAETISASPDTACG